MRIALPPAIDGSAFADHDPTAPIVTLSGLTMGTTWCVQFVPPRQGAAAAVRADIVARLDAIVAEMSHWAADSRLARFNRAAAGTWVTLPPDLAHVMAAGLRIAAASAGAFDPAIGRLVDLWGFGPPGPMAPPEDVAIEAARGVSGWQRLAFDPASRRLRQSGGVALDLSGIAKGFAVDAVAGLLRGAGVRHALVEVGGELAGFGIRPDGEPWWVDLEAPPRPPCPPSFPYPFPGAGRGPAVMAGIIAGNAQSQPFHHWAPAFAGEGMRVTPRPPELAPLRIALHGLAVATSGNYARGDHNLDPRIGRAITNGVVSASVLHASAMEADAWATALTVLGPADGIALADRTGLAARIVTLDEDGHREHLSAALQAMLGD